MKEEAQEDTDAVITKLCHEKLGVELQERAIYGSHRLGRNLGPGADGKKWHKPIIVRFVSYRDWQSVLGAKKNLIGSGIMIKEDLKTYWTDVLKMPTYDVKNTWTQNGKVFWVNSVGRRGLVTWGADLAVMAMGSSKDSVS